MKEFIVKYKTVKNATQYQIAVQKKGAKKWKLYISKKLSKKVTKLAKGKKYNVKVRGVTREDVNSNSVKSFCREINTMINSHEGIRIISERVKNYRIDYPLTQKQLADRSGVSLRSIQRFEKGEDIQFGNLVKLLIALGLDDNVEMLVPDVTSRPAAFVDDTFRRQRVRAKKESKETNEPFRWGDEK